MTLKGVMALNLGYFSEFGSFRGALRKSGWRCRRKKSSRYGNTNTVSDLSKYYMIVSSKAVNSRAVKSRMLA